MQDKGGGAAEASEELFIREPMQELIEAGGGRCELQCSLEEKGVFWVRDFGVAVSVVR